MVLQRQLAPMQLRYLFSQAQPAWSLGDLIFEHMLSRGTVVKAVAHIWPSSPFWLALAL